MHHQSFVHCPASTVPSFPPTHPTCLHFTGILFFSPYLSLSFLTLQFELLLIKGYHSYDFIPVQHPILVQNDYSNSHYHNWPLSILTELTAFVAGSCSGTCPHGPTELSLDIFTILSFIFLISDKLVRLFYAYFSPYK